MMKKSVAGAKSGIAVADRSTNDSAPRHQPLPREFKSIPRYLSTLRSRRLAHVDRDQVELGHALQWQVSR